MNKLESLPKRVIKIIIAVLQLILLFL
ncbi:small toxic protein shoB [Escherichia coli]|nr:small toxic protein shoB [Escherichia coli]